MQGDGTSEFLGFLPNCNQTLSQIIMTPFSYSLAMFVSVLVRITREFSLSLDLKPNIFYLLQRPLIDCMIRLPRSHCFPSIISYNWKQSLFRVRAACNRKAWEFHPVCFPALGKYHAESKFKLASCCFGFWKGHAAGALHSARISRLPAHQRVTKSEKDKGYCCTTCRMVEEMVPLRSPGFADPGWEHGIAQDERKKKVKCNYCGKIVSGGIYRLKQHLARISGEVTYCKKAPEEVYLKMKENLEGCRSVRKQRQSEDEEQPSLDFHSNDDDEEEEEPVGYKCKGKQVMGDKSLVISLAPLRSLGYVDPGWEHGVAQDERKKKVKCNYCEKIVSGGINRFKQHLARIPGEVAYCKKAPEDVYHKMKENMKWHRTGRRQRRPDAKEIAAFYMPSDNDDEEEEQEEDLVHGISKEKLLIGDNSLGKDIRKIHRVITENTSSYKAAGKMLEEKRRKLFWTPCASYCIDQMLEDFLKIKWVRECMEKGKRITKFIYNRMWLLNLMKKEFTEGQELLRPAVTRFATSFVTLRSLLDHRTGLKRMFQSNKWLSSQFSKLDEGKEVEKIVLNATFWKKMQYVRKSVDPIMQVLQKVDSDESLSMPSIYNDMYRAKLAIKVIHSDDVRKYEPFWSIIDNHWNSFHHPLFMAAYFLNPSYRYRPDFVAHPEVIRGLNECIVRLEPDSGRRISASMQISDFVSAKADFGTELAISTRMELDPEKQALQEDEEILYNEMEHVDADENDVNENEYGNEGKGPLEMVTLADVIEPFGVNPATVNAATDEDDLDFLDDDLTDYYTPGFKYCKVIIEGKKRHIPLTIHIFIDLKPPGISLEREDLYCMSGFPFFVPFKITSQQNLRLAEGLTMKRKLQDDPKNSKGRVRYSGQSWNAEVLASTEAKIEAWKAMHIVQWKLHDETKSNVSIRKRTDAEEFILGKVSQALKAMFIVHYELHDSGVSIGKKTDALKELILGKMFQALERCHANGKTGLR
ncbi:hypothetical protein HHK36_026369 [Tetracentron sinense]|uniref:BED-type domain-containing protein n=1 Tax=Tetracentron sinense TaxID=13715 RepID=A0A834YGS0_TETSI|nr:hypothetical protein HHK36_026369 [Tetracentron sinense]